MVLLVSMLYGYLCTRKSDKWYFFVVACLEILLNYNEVILCRPNYGY